VRNVRYIFIFRQRFRNRKHRDAVFGKAVLVDLRVKGVTGKAREGPDHHVIGPVVT